MEMNLAVAFVACVVGGIFGGAITQGGENKELKGREEKQMAEEAIAEKHKIDWELRKAERKIETLKDKLRDIKPEEGKVE